MSKGHCVPGRVIISGCGALGFIEACGSDCLVEGLAGVWEVLVASES